MCAAAHEQNFLVVYENDLFLQQLQDAFVVLSMLLT